MTTVLDRWRGKLKTRTELLNAAEARVVAAAKVAGSVAGAKRLKEAKATRALRRAQVAYAKRVIARREASARPYSLSPLALRRVAPRLTTTQAKSLAVDLGAAMNQFGITNPTACAVFIAQICHESMQFFYTEEIASGAAYEWRSDLGNTHSGDGKRYKGRTYIQITGRFNYAEISKATGIDFLAHPERLSQQKYAALGAAWWFARHGCIAPATRGDFIGVTRIINGGTNGLADRQHYYGIASLPTVKAGLVPARR